MHHIIEHIRDRALFVENTVQTVYEWHMHAAPASDSDIPGALWLQ